MFRQQFNVRDLGHQRVSQPNGYVWTAGCVQETQLNAHTKHCLVKRGKQIKVSSSQWQWAGCIMADACMKFH